MVYELIRSMYHNKQPFVGFQQIFEKITPGNSDAIGRFYFEKIYTEKLF